MPSLAPTPCRQPGCTRLVEMPGYCDAHRRQVHRDYDQARRQWAPRDPFYKTSFWVKTRAAFLRANPLCVECSKRGLLVPSQAVDHILPIKMGGHRTDPANLQALCISCHNAKTARETFHANGD